MTELTAEDTSLTGQQMDITVRTDSDCHSSHQASEIYQHSLISTLETNIFICHVFYIH